MHRKHIRATVGAGDVDVPIGTFSEGQYVRLVGGILVTEALPATIVSGVPPTLDNAIARWDGTTGTLLQNSLVIISDTAQVTGVTALNGRDIARWTDGPAIGGATDSAIALWDGTTGRVLKNSAVTINDDGDITTPGDMNPDSIGSIPVGVLVRSSGGTPHPDNAVATWSDGAGNPLQDTTVFIDDLGNVTGVTTLNTRDPARWVDGPTPAVSVHGNITVWDGTSGRLIADPGLGVANIVYNLDSEVVTGHLPEFTDSAGRRITDSGIISDHVVTSAAVGVDNRIARYDGALRAIQSSAVSIDDSGDITGVSTINGTQPSTWVRGPASAVPNNIPIFSGSDGKAIYDSGVPGSYLGNMVRSSTSSVANFEIPLWIGTDGRVIAGSGILWNQVAFLGSPFSSDNRLVRTDTVTNNRAVQQSAVTLDDVGSLLGVVDLTMSGALNGRDPDEFVRGPGGATDNRLARFDGATGYLIQNSAITVDDSGNVTGVGTLNGATIANWAFGIASSTDNRVVRFDGSSGKQLQQSVVAIDDSGNVTGSNLAVGIASSTDNRLVRFDGTGGKQLQESAIAVDDSGAITGVTTINGVSFDAHGLRHTPGGADSIFATSGTGDFYERANSAGALLLPKNRRSSPTAGGSITTSYLTVLPNMNIAPHRASNGPSGSVAVHAWIPYTLGDTGSDLEVLVQWSGFSGSAFVTCGAQGGRISASGGTGLFDNSAAANSIPPGGIVHVFWSALSVTQGATVAVAVRSSGATHTAYVGHATAFEATT